MTVEDIIRERLSKWDMKPYDINSGNCEDFAMEVIGFITGSGETDETFLAWGDNYPQHFSDKHFPEYHCFVVHKGRFYDSECPEGVDSPALLPLFVRQLEMEVNHA